MNPDIPEMARKRTRTARICLTNDSTYSSVLHITTGYRAIHAECANTPHGSNPTLRLPVSGLRSIIHSRGLLVLRGLGGPTDSSVGLGRFGFPGWEMER
jgi:hypothetical protein